MSQFTRFSSFRVPTKEVNKFVLLDNLIYERGYEGSGDTIIVPDGFRTDFASIPSIFHIFFSPTDYRWILASCLHDYLWSKAKTLQDYQDGNDIFYEAMQVTGTPKIIAILFYLAVSISKYGYFLKQKLHNKYYSL